MFNFKLALSMEAERSGCYSPEGTEGPGLAAAGRDCCLLQLREAKHTQSTHLSKRKAPEVIPTETEVGTLGNSYYSWPAAVLTTSRKCFNTGLASSKRHGVSEFAHGFNRVPRLVSTEMYKYQHICC